MIQSSIVEQLKLAAPKELPKAVYRVFPATRANAILALVQAGHSVEEAIEKTRKAGRK